MRSSAVTNAALIANGMEASDKGSEDMGFEDEAVGFRSVAGRAGVVERGAAPGRISRVRARGR